MLYFGISVDRHERTYLEWFLRLRSRCPSKKEFLFELELAGMAAIPLHITITYYQNLSVIVLP